MKYKYIVFDLDGTLLDSVEDIVNALNETLRELKMNYSYSKREGIALLGSGALELARKVFNDTGYDSTSPFFNEFCEAYYTNYKKHQGLRSCLYPGVKETLVELKSQGVKVAVFSNKPQRVINNSLDGLIDISIFDFVLGQKDGYDPKPDPKAFLEELSERKIIFNKKDFLYVGDSDVDIIFARNLGIDSCGCAYGYRGKKELDEARATYIIDCFSEILLF